MYRLIRMTSKDYQDYRDVFSKIEYSVLLGKGMELPPLTRLLMKKEVIAHTLDIICFQRAINDPTQGFYFFEVDGVYKGFLQLRFVDATCCDIVEFSVHEKGVGLGRKMFNELLLVLKTHGIKIVRLYCHDELKGAQAFWRKMGFSVRYSNTQKYFERKVK